MTARRERPIPLRIQEVRAILDGSKTQLRRLLTKPRVRLPHPVSSEAIIYMAGRGRAAQAGLYPVEMNPHGAVSAILPDGQKLGLRPGEFHWLCPYAEGETQLEDFGQGKCWTITPEASRLWGKETWWRGKVRIDHRRSEEMTLYAASAPPEGWPMVDRWRSPILMSRRLSRLTLEVTAVRIERLQQISEQDAAAEGVARDQPGDDIEARHPGVGTYRFAFGRLWQQINGKRALWSENPWVWVVSFQRIEARP